MTTLICAQLGLGSRRLRYACAGHPPPLILSPGEEPCFAWEGRSTPLDVRSRPTDRAARPRSRSPPGSTVLLYTDGLVERRSESLTDGLDRLLREAAAPPDDTPAALAAAVVRALHDPEHVDDVCLLAARAA